jgi:hypothetical protein
VVGAGQDLDTCVRQVRRETSQGIGRAVRVGVAREQEDRATEQTELGDRRQLRDVHVLR